MRWPSFRRKSPDRTIRDGASHSQRVWFANVTKDPFGKATRRKTREQFVRAFFPLEEEDCF